MQKPSVHPDVIKWLEQRIPSLKLESGDDPESLMMRAQRQAGMFELLAIMRTLTRDN